jgi:NAD(P)-dependent dehydrogenase (short-subunit alcohol dehydrogenase family)
VIVMAGRLQDRIPFITGTGSVGPGWGNGRATAVRFAEEGAKIFAVDSDLDSTVETVDRVEGVGGEIVMHRSDVTDTKSVKAMVDACLARYGRRPGGHERGGLGSAG